MVRYSLVVRLLHSLHLAAYPGATPSTPHRTGCSLVLFQTSQRELRPLRTSSGLSAAVDTRSATGPPPPGRHLNLGPTKRLSLATGRRRSVPILARRLEHGAGAPPRRSHHAEPSPPV